LHEYRCQICGKRIALPDGGFYAEAHHIRPLGSPHNGPDHVGNILCVCPNHHVALDYLCLRLDKESRFANVLRQIPIPEEIRVFAAATLKAKGIVRVKSRNEC
jgi:predicted restriction endonuclease